MTAQLRQIYFNPVLAALDMKTYADEFALGKTMDIEGLIKMVLERAKPADE
jgi:hypothetical protein